MRPAIALLTLCAALVLWVGSAMADDVNTIGSVAAVDVNDDSADGFLLYNGRVFVRIPDGTLEEYRWGGTSCGTRVLNEQQVTMLLGALANKRARIEPRSQIGQGNVKCLVGFNIVDKKSVNLLP